MHKIISSIILVFGVVTQVSFMTIKWYKLLLQLNTLVQILMLNVNLSPSYNRWLLSLKWLQK